MSKLRSVNTHFWSDNYIIDLDPTEKLLFLYLLTNEKTNMLGIYELHIRKIAFETGIDKDMVQKIFDRFESDGKASYVDGYVCLHNFTKHQSYNTNMKKSAIKTFNSLPKNLHNKAFCEGLLKALKPFPKDSEPIAEYELEYEEEKEVEEESEKKEEKDKKEDHPLVDWIKNAEDEFGDKRFQNILKMDKQLKNKQAKKLIEDYVDEFKSEKQLKSVIVQLLDRLENHQAAKKNISVYRTLRHFMNNYLEWNDPKDEKGDTQYGFLNYKQMQDLFNDSGLGGSNGVGGYTTEDIFEPVKKNGKTYFKVRNGMGKLLNKGNYG